MTPIAHLPTWAKPLNKPARYKVLYGGRGSAKSWTVAQMLVLRAVTEPIRVACVREFQRSIAESSKQVIEDSIHRLGLTDHFIIRRDHIYGRNGSHFFFRGMSKVTEQSIRGWEAVDVVWVEEAHTMSLSSREILYPTIRKPGSEIWFTFNPRNRSDPVWQDFCTGSTRLGNAVVIKVNYDSNPWFPPELGQERETCLRDEPDRYPHIWLGEPDDEGSVRKVLPYGMLEQCVDAHVKLAMLAGRVDVGLDVADSGADKNALVARRGPLILHAESWSSQVLGETARRADLYCREHGARQLYFDVGGVGAGIRSYLAEMPRGDYGVHPVNFGSAVAGPTRTYTYRVSNKDFFARRNSQLAWALRLRAQQTGRLVAGEDVDVERCLFIDSRIPRIEAYLAQLSQPEWKEDMSGRVVIEKAPEDAPSPDLYDATALAFAADSRSGLRAG